MVSFFNISLYTIFHIRIQYFTGLAIFFLVAPESIFSKQVSTLQ